MNNVVRDRFETMLYPSGNHLTFMVNVVEQRRYLVAPKGAMYKIAILDEDRLRFTFDGFGSISLGSQPHRRLRAALPRLLRMPASSRRTPPYSRLLPCSLRGGE